MEFRDVVLKRESTRSFSNREVSDDIIMNILELSKMAPSAHNLQPWRVLVVKSSDGIEKIDKASPCRYNAPCVLVICSDTSVAWCNDEFSTYEMDASIFATHVILSATNLGVDNIWVKMFNKEIIKNEFSLGDDIEPVCLIPIGYRNEDYTGSMNKNNRLEVNDFISFR